MKTMKVGILGPGGIAHAMATTISQMEDVECYAVGSRDINRAKEFAQKYGFEKVYGSYEELVKDDQIDLIYVATPHSHHYEYMKLCLENGRNVLCEKAFTVNAKQAQEIVDIAKEKKLFVGEAIWTRYMPLRKTIDEIIASGVIGNVTSLTANLGYTISGVKRIQESALAGGALLDLSVYPLNFASMVFGDEIKEICSTAVITDKGVDSQDSITLIYNDGKMASLYTTTFANTDRAGIINGDKGRIVIDNINNYECVHVYGENRELIAEYPAPKQITGYEYEVISAKKAIENGEIEPEEMPHAQTVRMMKLMDSIRAQWNMTYECE